MLKRIILLIPVVILGACLEESSEKLDKKAFTKIYDNSEFYSSFYAIDMKQTADGGYLILGGKTSVVKEGGQSQNVNTPLGIYLLKVDEFGNMVTALELEETYIYPIGKLNPVGDSFYFFCMDAGTNAFLVNVDQLATFSQVTPVSPAITFPLASSVVDVTPTPGSGSLLLLGYSNSTQESILATVSTAGTVLTESRFYTGAESPIDDLVVNHANREGTQFPFEVGQTSTGKYFFNGFINYSFSLVITDLEGNEDVSDIVNGYQENAGFSSVLPVTGQIFALSTFSFGFNSLMPNADISTAEDVNDIQALAYSFPELENNARVKSIRGVLNGKNVIIFGSNTRSGQIGIYVYDETTGEFLSSKYLGYSNPFEIAALVQTVQGDLVVSGTTYIAGRLPRFCLIKVPKDEIKD